METCKYHVCVLVVHVRQQRDRTSTQGAGLRVIGFLAHVQAGEPQDLSEVRGDGHGTVVPLPVPGDEVLPEAAREGFPLVTINTALLRTYGMNIVSRSLHVL